MDVRARLGLPARRFAVDDSIDATRAATFRAAAVDITSTHIARETHTSR